MALYNFTQEDLKKLFVNRFVVLIGDSVMRTVYKDLVVMLQYGRKLTASECKEKGEGNFHNDVLIEGGKMTNGKDYREVRQYFSPQYLIRFYFVTRIYNGYVETIFADFHKSLTPDIVIVNSCLWDISRYGVKSMENYKFNLQKFCCNLKRLLSPRAAVIWTTTLPVSSHVRAGFLSQGTGFLREILRLDVLIANHFSFQVAKRFGFGVLDLHFLFRHRLHLLAKDGVHWMNDAHRDITNILMGYICRALNIVIPNRCRVDRLLRYQQPSYNESLMSFQESSSFCKAVNETEMSYCEGLYDEAPYSGDSSRAGNNWASDSFNRDSWVDWSERNYRTPDRNSNWLHRNIGKWMHGPEGSSTPNLGHIRPRVTGQSLLGLEEDLYLSFEEPADKASYGESERQIFPQDENFSKGNETIWSERPKYLSDGQLKDYDHFVEQQFNKQIPLNNISNFSKNLGASQTAELMRMQKSSVQNYGESNRPPLNDFSNFKDGWKPYQAAEILRTQKSSMRNFKRDKHVFKPSFNNIENKVPLKRFYQQSNRHNSSFSQSVYALSCLIPQLQMIASARQNIDYTFQRSVYQHRLRPY